MSIPRLPSAPAAALLVALFSFVGASPGLAQDASPADIWLRLDGRGSRMIGETEKNLAVDVLSNATIHAATKESLMVVLFVAQISEGRVVTRGETAPFRLDAGAAGSRGVPLRRVLSTDQLRGVAPLRPAEFVVKGHVPVRKPMNAAEAVADPGPAFPMYDGSGLFFAVVPADLEFRHRLTTQPLVLAVAVPVGH